MIDPTALPGTAREVLAWRRQSIADDRITARKIREWLSTPQRVGSWPTDRCTREQHNRYVRHRNANWERIKDLPPDQYRQFIRDYADSLDRE